MSGNDGSMGVGESSERKLLSFGRVVALIALAAFALGLWGGLRSIGGSPSQVVYLVSDALYNTIQLFQLEFGFDKNASGAWQIHIARTLALVVVVMLGGKAVYMVFRDSLDACIARLKAKNHTIICGLGDKGRRLALSCRARGEAVVAVESDRDNAGITACRRRGIRVIIGDACDADTLRSAGVERCRRLVAVSADAVNGRIAATAREVMAASYRPRIGAEAPVVLAHTESSDLFDRLSERMLEYPAESAVWVEVFNADSLAARALLEQHPLFGPKAGVPVESARVALISRDAFSDFLLREIAIRWSIERGSGDQALPVTLISADANAWRADFAARHPRLAACLNVESALAGSDSPRDLAGAYLAVAGERGFTATCVCCADEALGTAVALDIDRHMPRTGRDCQILLRAKGGPCHSIWLDQLGLIHGRSRVVVFSLDGLTCGKELFEMTDRDMLLARAIHEEYLRMRVEEEGRLLRSEPNLYPWHELRPDLREANRKQAQAMVGKLRTIGYDVQPISEGGSTESRFSDFEIERMARIEHDRWMAEKMAMGYVYGPERHDNAVPPTHPDIVEYEQLPERTKEYDRQPCRRIPLLLGRIGYVVVKTQGA